MFASKDIFLSSRAGYVIYRSVVPAKATTSYLTRTPSVAGSRTTWTFSAWIKPGYTAAAQRAGIFSASTASNNYSGLFFSSSNKLQFQDIVAGSVVTQWVTNANFDDTLGWIHVVLAYDTTQATATDRLKLYVNNNRITSYGTQTTPAQNTATGIINSTAAHTIGRSGDTTNDYLDGYITEVYFANGQALTPSSFGETNTTTGEWVPKSYTLATSTNNFYLNFSDNSAATAAALGKDYSANGNNYTPTNMSVTGTSYQCNSLTDTPTAYGAGGNFCTFNNRTPGAPYTAYGMLGLNGVGALQTVYGTFPVNYFNCYWELTNNGSTTSSVGLINSTYVTTSGLITLPLATTYGFRFTISTGLYEYTTNGSTWTTASTPGVQKPGLFIYVSQNSAAGVTGTQLNAGQRTFVFTPPVGYATMNTSNISAPAVVNPKRYWGALTYSGNDTTNSISNVSTSVPSGYKPDDIWFKCINVAVDWVNYNVINFAEAIPTASQFNSPDTLSSANSIFTSFNSNGFTVTNTNPMNNRGGNTYKAWMFNINGGSTATNTNGTITSTVVANPTIGSSLVKYTGNGVAGATVGHGLGATPDLILVKEINISFPANWAVYNSVTTASSAFPLNVTPSPGATSSSAFWNSTSPGNTTFTLGTGGAGFETNTSGKSYMARCYASITGVCEFGSSYTGNNASDGPYVPLTFKPKIIIIKNTTATAGQDWVIVDTTSSSTNPVSAYFAVNDLQVQGTSLSVNIYSSGFKITNTSTFTNQSGKTIIFMAWAESPFKYSSGR
jgi:hypothetical protein